MDDQLIERLLNAGESSTLDYKAEQYPFSEASEDEKSELLKDILAFANAWRDSTAYILIGVKEAERGPANVLGISDHLADHAVQQFAHYKLNRPIQFSYRKFEFEGKSIGIIEIPVQERPFYLRKSYGKLKDSVAYYRQGSATVEATLEEMIRMGTADNLKRFDRSKIIDDDKESARVQLGFEAPTGLYVDIFNPSYHVLPIKRVALKLVKVDTSQPGPLGNTEASFPLLARFETWVNGELSSENHAEQADIPARKEMRFVLCNLPPQMLKPFIDNPDSVALTVATFNGEIHRFTGAEVLPRLKNLDEMWRAKAEAEKPRFVHFNLGQGYQQPMGTVSFQFRDGGVSVKTINASQGFSLTDGDKQTIARELLMGRVIGHVGDYDWSIDS